MDQEILSKELSIPSQPLPALHSLRRPGSLPPEIWIQIFLHSLPPLNIAQAHQKTSLSLVSRLWNAIVDSAPILWSGITIADSATYVQKSLIKSSNHPIDVYSIRLIRISHLDPYCDGVCCEFLSQVKPHARRWRHVVLDVICDQRSIPSVTSLPSLKTLEFHSNLYLLMEDRYLAPLTNAHTPHLRDVSLHNLQFPRWNISFPPSLLRLHIRNVSVERLSSVEWLFILATCPKLVMFHLSEVAFRDSDERGGGDEDTGALDVVELAALQELELETVPVGLARDLLRQLMLPERCTISLRCTIDDNPASSFLTPALSRYKKDFQRVGEVDEMRIHASPFHIRLIVVGWRWRIDVNLWTMHRVRGALAWFGVGTEGLCAAPHPVTPPARSLIPQTPPMALELWNFRIAKSIIPRLAVIADLPCITSLKINSPYSLTQTLIFRYLSGIYDPDQQVPAWPFPGLCAMVLKGLDADETNALIHAIKCRSGDGPLVKGLEIPARLKRIEFIQDGVEPSQGGRPDLVNAPHNAVWSLQGILEVLEDDAESFWNGKRISKAETVG
ncbi:hypothetical protein FRC00_002941 [Tulasnella sp. 408]|nr:hypothetical protein FRC00_002941 [Tulasnella sp. 408]